MLWLVRLLIQNGICLFATWAFVTSTIGFAFALVYKNSPGLPIARLRGKSVYHKMLSTKSQTKDKSNCFRQGIKV